MLPIIRRTHLDAVLVQRQAQNDLDKLEPHQRLAQVLGVLHVCEHLF